MSNTPVKPLGYNVLVEIIPFEEKTASGIIVASKNEAERERKGRDLARIVEFGPMAFKGLRDCTGPADWGVKDGDLIELSTRYDGKFSRAGDYDKEYENYRYVTDQDIMGKAHGDFEVMLQKQLED